MKVYEDDCVCLNCKYFEHDCSGGGYENFFECVEWCTHKDEFIRDGFNEHDEIVECSGFSE